MNNPSAISLCFLIFFYTVCFGTASLGGEQDVTVGTGLVCDNAEELEQYISLRKGDNADAMVSAANQETDPLACRILVVAYIRDENIKAVALKAGFGEIARAKIVGIRTDLGWTLTEPTEKLIILPLEGRSARPSSAVRQVKHDTSSS